MKIWQNCLENISLSAQKTRLLNVGICASTFLNYIKISLKSNLKLHFAVRHNFVIDSQPQIQSRSVLHQPRKKHAASWLAERGGWPADSRWRN